MKLARCAGVLICCACGAAPAPPGDEPPIEDVAGMRAERAYYVKTERGAIFGGFDGALESPVEAGGRTIEPDADGRFFVELPGDEVLELSNGLGFRLRDPEAARRAAVRPAISGAGHVPNDLVIAGEGSGAFGVLVRSGDGGVSEVDLSIGLSNRSARIDGRPFFAAVIDAGARRVAVSDFDRSEVHLIDLAEGRVERTLAPPEVLLEEPFVLARPYDVDGDGTAETRVERFTARTPQALAAAGDRLLVAFTGFLERRLDRERGPLFLPSAVVSWSLADPDAPPRVQVLDAFNPQELRLLGDGRAIVVSSGILDQEGGVRAVTEGAITVLDPESLSVLDGIRMGDFAPGSALSSAGRVVVASLARARVRILGDAAQEIAINDETVDSVFRLVDLGGGLVGVPSFNTDRLHVLDARTGELDPAPFFGPLAVGPGRPVFDGLQIVAARPGRRGVDFVGPDLLALTGIASELVPIELRKVMGP